MGCRRGVLDLEAAAQEIAERDCEPDDLRAEQTHPDHSKDRDLSTGGVRPTHGGTNGSFHRNLYVVKYCRQWFGAAITPWLRRRTARLV